MLKKIFLWVIILIIVLLTSAYFVRNLLVEKAVEAGTTYALGVETDLGSASLNIGGGSLELDDFEVDNPEGFAGKHFLTLQRGKLSVETGSVLDNMVVVDSLIIEGVDLNLEQVGKKGNYQELLDNIGKIDNSSSEDSHKFRIGLIALRDINVNGSLDLLGKKVEKSFTLDNFQLRDVGGDSGAKIGEVAATMIKTLISKALAKGNGLLPEGFGKDISNLKEQGIEEVKNEATKKLKDVGESLTGGKK